jgi:hypothetical protein
MKHANALERKVPGRPLSDKPVSRLRERNFISKIPPAVKKSKTTEKMCCTLKAVYWCDVGLSVKFFHDYTPSRISKVIQYYSY